MATVDIRLDATTREVADTFAAQPGEDVLDAGGCLVIPGLGGGVAYGSHGYTHHGVEDLAVMSAMPNLAVAAPGDPIEARFITRMMADRPGPAYLRIGKAGEPANRDKLSISFNGVRVAHKGMRDPSYDENEVSALMKQPKIKIKVALGLGAGRDRVLTCDLTK